MNATVSSVLAGLTLGGPRTHGPMNVFPLVHEGFLQPEYFTLHEAMAKNLITVTEVSEGGSVPELSVASKATLPVLILDGEELAGAKQNRVLNITVLVPPEKTTIIPVSCTEHGRWSYKSAGFGESGERMSYAMKAKMMRSVTDSLKCDAVPRSDQAMVWDEIAELSEKHGSRSHTGAMKDAYDTAKPKLDQYLAACSRVDGQKGLLVFINGKPAGFDFVSRDSAYTALHQKFIKSYAMDAMLEQEKADIHVSFEQATAFLEEINGTTEHVFPSTGLGTDLRFESSSLIGSALVFEDVPVHVAFFSLDGTGPEQPAGPRMNGYKKRKSNRQPKGAAY